MLEIRNVHKTFNPGTINEKHALNGVNLKLEEGDFVTVIGGNGAGKGLGLSGVVAGFILGVCIILAAAGGQQTQRHNASQRKS